MADIVKEEDCGARVMCCLRVRRTKRSFFELVESPSYPEFRRGGVAFVVVFSALMESIVSVLV